MACTKLDRSPDIRPSSSRQHRWSPSHESGQSSQSDSDLIHACANDTNAHVPIAHPGPNDESTNCTVVTDPGWSNVDWDNEWLGADTSRLSPSNLTDNVGIGTATPNEHLEITGISDYPAPPLPPVLSWQVVTPSSIPLVVTTFWRCECG